MVSLQTSPLQLSGAIPLFIQCDPISILHTMCVLLRRAIRFIYILFNFYLVFVSSITESLFLPLLMTLELL